MESNPYPSLGRIATAVALVAAHDPRPCTTFRYCREAGVRNLQKHIEKICRKVALKVVRVTQPREEAAQKEAEQKAAEEEERKVAAEEVGDAEVRATDTEEFIIDHAAKEAQAEATAEAEAAAAFETIMVTS